MLCVVLTLQSWLHFHHPRDTDLKDQNKNSNQSVIALFHVTNCQNCKWGLRSSKRNQEQDATILRWWGSAPLPSLACRPGPGETEISQIKLMWTSGGESTYSLSRLSSLWLLVHSDTLPFLCKTVLFLQPPKGVQQWLNTPRWPYQLFYYFSHGRGFCDTKWQKSIFNLEI